MGRLVDADALWMDVIHSVDYCDDILEFIERQPTVEPDQKKGQWVEIPLKNTVNPITGKPYMYRGCSECGAPIPTDSALDYIHESELQFCYSCGARLSKDEDR